jgi:tetratricopeptide (TPR) repeat protein
MLRHREGIRRLRAYRLAPGVFLGCVLGLLLTGVIGMRSASAQQSRKSPTLRVESSKPLVAPLTLTAELQGRLQALESAKQSGDPVAIGDASKSVLALGLREFAGLELVAGSASEAVETYRRSINFENSVETRIDLAQAYIRARRVDESLAEATDALVADPTNARAWYVQGKMLLLKKRYEDAVKSFKNSLAIQDDPAAWYLLGASLLQLKQREEAQAAFHKLANSSGGNIHVPLADAYREANYVNDYKREAALAVVSGTAATRGASRMSVMDRATLLGSLFELAKPTLQRRKQTEPLQSKLRIVLGSAFNDLGTAEAQQQQFGLALDHFHEAAKWNPDAPGLMRNMGIAAGRAEDYPECIRALKPVLAAAPQDTTARAMLGTALFAAHSYADAVQVFTPLGDSALQLHELAYSWAASLANINKIPEATSLLEKLEEQRLSAETEILVAQLWSQMGAYEKTVASCSRALQSDPSSARAHYYAGLALVRLDRSAEATQEFQAALQLDPENTDAQFDLAFSLLQQSQTQKAVDLLKAVLARNPDHAEANYELGKELQGEKKSSEAVGYLEAAVRLRPEFAPARYQLQAAYRSLGRTEDADREAKVYRTLKAKSRDITLPTREVNAASSSTH